MKIEVGESLIYSYLKHVKKCLITQTNWKASGNWDVLDDIQDEISYEFDKIKNHHAFSDMFGNQQLKQVIKQAEIDALGINLDNQVYAFEMAFHENGLQYGGKIETRNRIFKKLLRGYLTLKYYFPNRKYTIAFCSPKVNNATQVHINDYFEVLKNEFQSEDISFEYYSNERFSTEIVQKTLENTMSEADSSELFSRAIKLLKLSKEFEQTPVIVPAPVIQPIDIDNDNFVTTDSVIIGGINIPTSPVNGESLQNYVKRIMRILIHQNLLLDDEIRRLQREDYCRRVFHPLKHSLLLSTTETPIDAAGHARYWTGEIFGNFYICSQWWVAHRSQYLISLKQWLIDLEKQENQDRLSA